MVEMLQQDRKYYLQQNPDHNITVNEASKAVRVHTKNRQHYFSYKTYGSKDNALKAARVFRDSFPDSSFRGVYDADKAKPRGVSGVRGVKKGFDNNGNHTGWIAQWQEGRPPDRRQRQKRFSFKKYGEDAMEYAAAFRIKQVLRHSISRS